MREKTLKLIVTFHTTTESMKMEKICKEQGVGGRLIPVPRALSASCGMAWCAELSEREQVIEAMKLAKIELDSIHECMV